MVSGGEREQNDEKVDGRWCPSGEETQAFHHSSLALRGLHPRPFLTATPAVPFLPRQAETKKSAIVMSCLTIVEVAARRLIRTRTHAQSGSLRFFPSPRTSFRLDARLSRGNVVITLDVVTVYFYCVNFINVFH